LRARRRIETRPYELFADRAVGRVLAPHMARMSLERMYADEDLDEAIDAPRERQARMIRSALEGD